MRSVWRNLCAVLRIRSGFEAYDDEGNLVGLSIPDVAHRELACLDLKLSTLPKIRVSSTRPRVAEYEYSPYVLQVVYLEGYVTLRLLPKADAV